MALKNAPVNLFKRTFTKAEWEQIEEFLIQEVNAVTLPDRVTPDVIQQINSQIDDLTSAVMWLYALTKRTYEAIGMDRKNAEKQVYMLVKDGVPDASGNKPSKAPTEAEKQALIVDYLNVNPLQGHPAPIYVMEKAAMERFLFVDAVVSTMKQKREALITDLGAIKLEVAVNPSGGVDVDDDRPVRRVS